MYKRLIVASVLACSAAVSLAMAQGSITGVAGTGNWTIHTAAKPGCPGIALRIKRDGDTLKGFAESGDMSGVSSLSGTINANQQFMLTMTQMGGKGPQGTLSGSRNQADGWLVADLKGSGCTDGPLKIETYVPGAGAR